MYISQSFIVCHVCIAVFRFLCYCSLFSDFSWLSSDGAGAGSLIPIFARRSPMHIGIESVASITAVNIDEVNLAAVLIPNVVGLKYPYIFAYI